MSCPGETVHAHAPFAAEARVERTARGTGMAWMSGWVVSLIGHAGVAAVVLLAPTAKSPDKPTGTILVEFVGLDAVDTASPARAIADGFPESAAEPATEPSSELIEKARVSEPEPVPAEHTPPVETPPPVDVVSAFPIPPPKPPPPQAIVAPVRASVSLAQDSAPRSPAKAEARTGESVGSAGGPVETAMRPAGAASGLAKAIGDNRKPAYPAYARRRGIEGRVILSVTVSADGNVAHVGIAQSSRYDVLDEAAVEAVRKWRFRPAHENGQAIVSTINVPITFRLNEDR